MRLGFKSRVGFYKMYELGRAEGLNNHAIFTLHQAAERFYSTLLLVFNDYKPKIHDLEDLSFQARIIDWRFKAIFPTNNEEDDRLFVLLKKGYVDARYQMGYRISEDDLQRITEKVLQLKELVEEVCSNRLRNDKLVDNLQQLCCPCDPIHVLSYSKLKAFLPFAKWADRIPISKGSDIPFQCA